MGDKIAVVTGAGSGIGAAAATALASDGWTVVLAGRRRTQLEDVATAYPDLDLHPVPTDVTDEASVRDLFEVTVARHGRVDLLFNNAGMGGPARELDEIPLEEWQAIVNVNLTAPFSARVRPSASCVSSDPKAVGSSTTVRSPRMCRDPDPSPIPRPSTPSPG